MVFFVSLFYYSLKYVIMQQYQSENFIDVEKFKVNFSDVMKKELTDLDVLIAPHLDNMDWFTLDFEPTKNQLVFLSQYGSLRSSYDIIENKNIIQFKNNH